jgi:ribosomal protein L11 methyltransferase
MQARKPYDLVFANILMGPLVRLAAPMAKLLAPGATVILSGLLHAHANAALAAYRAQGLHLVRRIKLDEWTTLVLAKGGAKPRRLS